MKRLILTASIASVCGHAAAQTVDYAALEQLFGEPVTTSVTGSPQRASEVPASGARARATSRRCCATSPESTCSKRR
jgi:hypothetical protein